MHPHFAVIACASNNHTDQSSKTRIRVLTGLEWRCLIYLSLFATHTSMAAIPDTADTQAVPHRIQFNTTKHAQGTATTSTLQPVITKQNDIYTVFDSQRREHAFRQHKDGGYEALNSTTGSLNQTTNGQFRWTDSAGQRFHFSGSTLAPSQPASIQVTSPMHKPNGKNDQQLNEQQLSESASSAAGTTVSTPYECKPSATTLPEGTDSDTDSSTLSSGEQPSTPATAPVNPTTTPDETAQCDTETAGPHTFSPHPYSGPQTTLDARPASCESYFVQYYGTDRGFEIEAGLQLHSPYNHMQSTVRNFPVIDFIDESRLVVAHSRDLGNRTFNSPSKPEALLDQLLKDGEEIQTRFVDVLHQKGSISASERGQSTTISADQLRPITLQLVIRDGIASADHWRQIATARERLMRLYGITLEVVVIP